MRRLCANPYFTVSSVRFSLPHRSMRAVVPTHGAGAVWFRGGRGAGLCLVTVLAEPRRKTAISGGAGSALKTSAKTLVNTGDNGLPTSPSFGQFGRPKLRKPNKTGVLYRFLLRADFPWQLRRFPCSWTEGSAADFQPSGDLGFGDASQSLTATSLMTGIGCGRTFIGRRTVHSGYRHPIQPVVHA
jgi:hypothetical protein